MIDFDLQVTTISTCDNMKLMLTIHYSLHYPLFYVYGLGDRKNFRIIFEYGKYK
jgi:hypothetical protein